MFTVGRVQYKPIQRNSPNLWDETRQLVDRYATKILDHIDPDGEIGYRAGLVAPPVRRRQGATVGTYTTYSRRHEARHQALEKGLDYVRGSDV